MISPVDFSKKLFELGFDTTIGVPDSTFKGLISYFNGHKTFKQVIASNECEAMGIASGYYLSQQKPALVYMQNSGFCKTINPYTSLLSADVYSIPVLMLVGWRGEPGKKDEPQHKMMGRIMIDLIKVMEIDYTILSEADWEEQLVKAARYVAQNECPYIIAVKKGSFSEYSQLPETGPEAALSRERVIRMIVEEASEDVVFVSTTGKTSRELFEIREQREEHHGRDFYTVGSMGCASSIALGIGLGSSNKKVFVLDGDGAALMQLGTMATIGHYPRPNLKHIIIDNNAHESTGGQPTVSATVDFMQIARGCHYEYTRYVDNEEQLRDELKRLETNNQLSLLVIKVKKGSRPDLGRPTTTPRENRDAFLQNFK
jgi:phosphonopyruvate decarboxylase